MKGFWLPVAPVERQSVATPQAARGRACPPCRHFKIQSCCCLGLLSRLLSNPCQVLMALSVRVQFLVATDALELDGEALSASGVRLFHPWR